ncbi:MAG TPA: glycosyltransferase [Candidatus Limnocylindrales bacterium]
MIDRTASAAPETRRGAASLPAQSARRRAVVLVGNPAAPYSRALRIARALVDEGYDVEIAATTGEDVPDREREGRIEWRRYRPSGFFARMVTRYRTVDPTAAPRPGRSPLARAVRAARDTAGGLWRWAFWPHTVRGWWRTLDRQLEPADLYHACGSLTIAAALAARRRDRKAGRDSRAIYDFIDITSESNNVVAFPRLVRRWVAYREARWARTSDAVTTVNDALADRLVTRFRLAERPIVVPNYPMPRKPSRKSPDLFRAALGLTPETRIVLFQGRLGPNLGLAESAEAVLRVPDAALVLMGFGRWYQVCSARDREARFAGRHFTLPAVHPDELASWTASADVALVPLPPISFNQRHAMPNKFLEAIVAGTPIVLGPDLPSMEAILRRFRLGRVARSLGPEDLAAAIGEILDRPAAERATERSRIAVVGAEHFTWPAIAERYRQLVRRVAPDGLSSGSDVHAGATTAPMADLEDS